jgi:uncharacterized protein (DUF983 family)
VGTFCALCTQRAAKTAKPTSDYRIYIVVINVAAMCVGLIMPLKLRLEVSYFNLNMYITVTGVFPIYFY